MKDGYYLSVYVCINDLLHLMGNYLRHDQNISLWKKQGNHIELISYLEVERVTGKKHGEFCFYSKEDVLEFIEEFLERYQLTIDDIEEIWGTPQIHNDTDYYSIRDYENIAYHSISHLFSGILWDSKKFYHDKILGMAVDAGPDSVMDYRSMKKYLYSGCVVEHGKIEITPISSPAILWGLAAREFNLQEGTLMALATACKSKAYLQHYESLRLEKVSDIYAMKEYFFAVKQEVFSLEEKDCTTRFSGFDPNFSIYENQISMVMKEIQRMSNAIMVENIEQMIQKKKINPEEYYLSLSGGYALNCPCTSYLMEKYNFKGYLAPPCINDSGISLGMALYAFWKKAEGEEIEVDLKHAFYGYKGTSMDKILEEHHYDAYIADVSEFDEDKAARDLIENPVVWFAQNAEIGPRALGHRSILADSRKMEMKDKLNKYKKRQWWRPVAPIVRKEYAQEYFENCTDSPFMLRTYKAVEGKENVIPAVLHLDGTARVQTLDKETEPQLDKLIAAFQKITGVPVIGNTSLNDRGEPIINTIEEALNFALRKKIKIVYVNSLRVELKNHEHYPEKKPLARKWNYVKKFDKQETEQLIKQLNPYGISSDYLLFYYTNGLQYILDLKKEKDAGVVKSKIKRSTKNGGVDIFMTKRKIRLELAGLEDAELLTSIQMDAFQEEVKKYGHGPEGFDSVDTTRYRILNRYYYKILNDDEVVGGVFVLYQGGGIAVLDGIFIRENDQGRGLGSLAMEQLEQNFPDVTLWSVETPIEDIKQNAFYKRHGYQKTGEKDQFLALYHKSMKQDIDQLTGRQSSKDMVMENTSWAHTMCDYMTIDKAEFYHTNLGQSDFHYFYADELAVRDSQIKHAQFQNVSISGEEENSGLVFRQCNLRKAMMEEVELSELCIKRGLLQNAYLNDCSLEGMKIEHCNTKGMTIEGIPVEELFKAYYSQNK